MAKEQFQTRLESDTAERVEAYRDDHDLTSAEAVRRLVTAGLDSQEQPTRAEIRDDLRRITDSVDGLAADLDDLADDLDDDGGDQEMATARMNQTARQSGTILMLLLLGFLAAAEVGLL